MPKKSKNWLAVALFVLVFGILLLLASLFDLQLSQFLTAKAMAGHTYITNDSPFAALVEICGSEPAELIVSLAICIFFWYGHEYKEGFKKYLLTGSMFVLNTVSNYVLVYDVTVYTRQHEFLDPDPDYAGGYYLILFYLIGSLFISVLELLATRNIPKEALPKLIGFSIAVCFLAAIPNMVTNLGIKAYVGRIRFRAMNMYPDNPAYGFAAFANWYEVKGQWLDDIQKTNLFGNTDALKSFPSGHTCAAGMGYGLTMLNDALDIKNIKIRAFNWILPIVVTGLVAIGRIMIGAHFFSDVLFGGTISFLTMILVREIFVCKGSNVKIMFSK